MGMKHLKSYNESIRDYLKPKSDEDIKKEFKKIPFNDLLWISIEDGRILGVENAIERGVDVNMKDHYNSNITPLIKSIIHNHIDIVKLLIDNGADVNITSLYNKTTPLMWAAKYGRNEIIELLINNGADVNAKDIDKKSVLSYVPTAKTYHATIKLLRKYGATL